MKEKRINLNKKQKQKKSEENKNNKNNTLIFFWQKFTKRIIIMNLNAIWVLYAMANNISTRKYSHLQFASVCVSKTFQS